MEKVCLGKVVKLHGYLGQMKVQTEYDKDFDANKIKEIANEKDEIFKVSRIFKNTDGVVVKLEGVELEQAKTYIGKLLYIDRSVMGDKILFEDLKGSIVVFEDETELGKITDVQDY
jgi:ribosomal 30S subunit maturation factor RimM